MASNYSVQKWFYVSSHIRILLRHMTLKRGINLLINQCEYLLRRQSLVSYPGFIKIDPSNRCQLRCPGCGQASDEFRAALPKKGFLTLDDFKQIVDPLASTTLGISLDQLGEPLLNKDIVSLLEHAKTRNIGVTIATNLSLRLKDDFLRRLVNSGIDKLMISLDGASSETYEQYRVKGNFDLVLANVRKLADLKRELRSKTPMLLWKFIVFDHNRHEVPLVSKTYKELGFDSYRIDTDRAHESVVSSRQSIYGNHQACFFPYSTVVLDVDGTVKPCCSFAETNWQLGNALTTDIRRIWNDEPYKFLRRGFARKNYGDSMHPVCKVCTGGAKELVEIMPEKAPPNLKLIKIAEDKNPSAFHPAR